MILLIDDSDQERAVIRKMLESGGHEVREATGGDAGLALFGALRPALVICDLMMPVKDGFDTIAEMQGIAADARIIAMSGVWYGTTDHAAMAKTLGLVAVIEKPFERAALLRLVSRTLNPPAQPKAEKKAKKKGKKKAKARPRPPQRKAAKSRAAAKAKRRAKPKKKM